MTPATATSRAASAALLGQPLDVLDTPQLLIDLDVVDANLQRLLSALRGRPVAVRVHFKSLKCAGLARYLAAAGIDRFLCAKLCEAEVLADAGLRDLFIANQIVGHVGGWYSTWDTVSFWLFHVATAAVGFAAFALFKVFLAKRLMGDGRAEDAALA